MDVVGCYNFCLRKGFGDAYIPQVLRGKWDDWRGEWVYVDVSPHDRLSLPRSLAEPNKPIWDAAPAEDARLHRC